MAPLWWKRVFENLVQRGVGEQMQLKTGVKLRGLQPELLLALIVADGIYKKYFARDLVVTSVTDGCHKVGSKHFVGQAADLRLWGLEGRVESIVSALVAALGEDFDVVPEKDHIHLEYDPK